MSKEDYLYVANDYYHDANDFLQRYRLTVDNFYTPKSKRFKLFIDLRMAAECALKANIAYHTCPELCRKDVIDKTEGYKHSIIKMKNDVEPFLGQELLIPLDRFFLDLDRLPVGLRYRLDGMDYREANEEFYYLTVGDDDWLDGLNDELNKMTKEIGKRLSSHSRIIPSSELIKEFFQPNFNKYRNRKYSPKK